MSQGVCEHLLVASSVSIWLLVLFALLKLANLAMSLRWAIRYGADYASERRLKKPESKKQLISLIRKHHGDFFPFGAKSIRLYVFDAKPGIDRLIGWTYRGTLFYLAWALLATIVTLILGNPRHGLPQAAIALSLLVDAYAIGLLAEAIVWYLVTDDYAAVWGGIKSSNFTHLLEKSESRLRDVVTLGGLAAVAGTSIASSVALADYYFGSFGESHAALDGWGRLGLLVAAANYVASTVTTIGAAGMPPTGVLGQTISLLTLLLTILIITLLASILAARVQQAGGSAK